MEWHALGWVAVVLYAGAEALSIRALVQPRGLAPVPLLMAVGLALHFADLELVGRALHSVPYRTIGGPVVLFWLVARGSVPSDRRLDVALRLDARRLLRRPPLPASEPRHRPLLDPLRHPFLRGGPSPSHGFLRAGRGDPGAAPRPARHVRDPRLCGVHVLLRAFRAVPHSRPADPAGTDRASLRAAPAPRGDRTDEPHE